MVGRKSTVKKEETTTISLGKSVAIKLEEIGHMHDTYSTVIQRLIDYYGNGTKPDERGKPREDE